MINLSNEERETLWLNIFKKELFNLLNENSDLALDSSGNI